ncbi:MAG: FMN-binding protein [Defluviitaleaceae bacterium]|nr:FMN-binding protein [Defluviitaleaceae bacterium]
MKNDFVKPTVVLLLVTLFSAAIIGITHAVTEGPIQAQRANIEMEAVLALLPNTYRIEYFAVDEADSSLTRLTVSYDRHGETIGYVFSALPTGYGGRINMMVALDLYGVVLGIRIINHTETPGLGANITRDWFLGAFAGHSDTIAASDVPVIASSTISVSAVLRGANDAINYLKTGGLIQ